MKTRAMLFVVIASILAFGACDYIVTPAEESSPTPTTAGVWSATATAIS